MALFNIFCGKVAPRASSQASISRMNANNVIVFLGYTWLKEILKNWDFSGSQVKSQGKGATRSLWQ